MEINELAVMAKNGDLEAFNELYRLFAQRIFCFIRRKIQNRQDAEDVLQEIFIKSYKGLAKLRPDNLNFTAWIFKIASNTANDHLRKRYRQPEITTIDEGVAVSAGQSLQQAVAAKMDFEQACENFKFLPVRHRSVMELMLFRQLSVGQAAEALNTSRMAIRIIQYRARKKLRYILSEA